MGKTSWSQVDAGAPDGTADSVTTEPPTVPGVQTMTDDDGSWCAFLLREGKIVLHFTMLAASTIGPGTVIVCSKSGADYGLKLVWTLVLASFIAYALQEGSARLCIVSRFSLGQAMRYHFRGTSKLFKIPIICGVVATGIIIGNGAYEANNFVGAIEAMYALTVPENIASRICMHLTFGILCCATLFFGAADQISQALGVVVVIMVGLFSISAGLIGINGEEFGRGLIPTIPSGGSVIALSMVATTAIPFNCFLASCAAEGHSLSAMRRGIAFSTLMAGILSILIVVTGTGVKEDGEFTVQDITHTLKRTEGMVAGYGFGFGLFAAAFSSALTVALGAALTVQSLVAPMPICDPSHTYPHASLSTAAAAAAAIETLDHSLNPVHEDEHRKQQQQQQAGGLSDVDVITTVQCNGQRRSLSISDVDLTITGDWHEDGMRFRSVILLLVLVSFSIGASGMSTVSVVLAAQVVNGLILPLIAICLLICLNNDTLMRSMPMTWTGNMVHLGVVTITVFLAANTVVGFFTKDDLVMTTVSAGLTAIALVPIVLYIRRLHAKKGQRSVPNRDDDTARETSESVVVVRGVA